MRTNIEKRIEECIKYKEYIKNNTLEQYLVYASLYSKKHWLILLSEKLRRNELEIYI